MTALNVTDLGGFRDGLTVVALQDIWRGVTNAQRAALLMRANQRSTVHPRVLANLHAKGLIGGRHHLISRLGVAVVKWRPGKEERG